ncbi:MAG: sugar transferase [Firmicutes bacterium]|nr:sugar transferase [Candidatus Colimorpha enterica]
MYCRYVKGILDRIFAFLLIILLSWLYIIVAIAVKIDDPSGPIIFSQDRIGKNGKVYKMFKFRSMCVGAEKMAGGVYSDRNDERVTRVGKLLRRTSIDELPQFFNIIKGDMSFIGYRSPLTYHPWRWEEYTETQKKMFDIKPGITGWAQINGRRSIDWQRRIELNLWYRDNVSFMLDMRIVFLTIGKVLSNSDNENIKKI